MENLLAELSGSSRHGCLLDSDAVDAQLQDAARNLDFHLIANLFVEQALCDRSLYGDFSCTEVSLLLTYDGVGHLGVCGKICHLDL